MIEFVVGACRNNLNFGCWQTATVEAVIVVGTLKIA